MRVVLGEPGDHLASIGVPYHRGETLSLVTDRSVTCSLVPGDATSTAVQASQVSHLPVAAGTVFGKLTYLVAGQPVGEANLVASASVPRPALKVKFVYFWGGFVAWLRRVL